MISFCANNFDVGNRESRFNNRKKKKLYTHKYIISSPNHRIDKSWQCAVTAKKANISLGSPLRKG